MHELASLHRVNGQTITYTCACGACGYANAAYPQEHLVAKAKAHHRTHARRATGRCPR